MQELVARKPDVILAYGPEAALKAAIAATKTIPIVMVAIDYDPLALGHITSLARPIGNVTGLYLQQIELAAKRIEMLRDAFPAMKAATVFWDALSADQWQATKASAEKLGLQLAGVELRDYPYDYEKALAQVPAEHRQLRHDHDLAVPGARPRASRAVRHPTAHRVDVRVSRIRGTWRADDLRTKPQHDVPACRRLCAPDRARRQAGRSADRAAGHVRACHQSQDREAARPGILAGHAAARR